LTSVNIVYVRECRECRECRDIGKPGSVRLSVSVNTVSRWNNGLRSYVSVNVVNIGNPISAKTDLYPAIRHLVLTAQDREAFD